jgi:site-specific DNA-methyltransferase (adenine-specific)/modification methylase
MPASEIAIKLGDCIAGMKKLEAGSVSLVFADPPYNLSASKLVNKKSFTGGAFHKVNEKWDQFSDDDYAIFSDAWIGESHRVLKDSGAIYVCASHHNLAQMLVSLAHWGFQVKNILVWEKPNAMPNMTRRTYTHSTELIVWAVKGKGWTFNYEDLKAVNPDKQLDGSPKMLRDVWRLPVVQGAERLRGEDGRALHPTQKPEALVERCVLASSNPGELVIDPFSGSGTTAVICARLGRAFIGFEMDGTYLAASKKRVSAELKKLKK